MNENERKGYASHHTLLKAKHIFTDIYVYIDDPSIKLLLLTTFFPDEVHEIFDLVDFLVNSVWVLSFRIEDQL